jgi:hypothetical protein
MNVVKKSFNLSSDVAQRLDDFVTANPGLSFTVIVNQALETWLKNPKLALRIPTSHTEEDVDAVIAENQDVFDRLAK